MAIVRTHIRNSLDRYPANYGRGSHLEPHGAHPPSEWYVIEGWGGQDLDGLGKLFKLFGMPAIEFSDAEPLLAFVNHGKWVVQCDTCNAAQLAHVDDLKFFCTLCSNLSVGGKWRHVEFPTDPTTIEAALEMRPLKQHRNWLSHESVADLHDENMKHGVY